ncbi:hypothetical protein KFE98_10655 [bacterium SCSIO 12741]|nr:hypothetical protein KFE98_10655 [bacterium SCSIO 12741]
MMTRKILYLLLSLSLIGLSAGCGEKSKKGLVAELNSRADFDRLKNQPLSSKYGKTETVKFYFNRASKQLYFIDSKVYRLHYHFAEQVLGYWRGHYFFNEYAYSDDPDRDEYFGDLNYYPDLETYALEFAPSDGISSDQIAACYRAIKQSSYVGEELKLLAVNPHQQKVMSAIEPKVDLLFPDDVFKQLTYQPLILGTCYGYLRKWTSDSLKKKWPSPQDILLLDHTPLDLPPTAGVLCKDFQTPLSHLTVLCANRRAPFASYRPLFTDSLPQVDTLLEELVKMTVTNDSFFIEKATLSEAQLFWNERMPQKRVKLSSDLEKRGLITGNKLGFKSVSYTGSKAANYGELKNIPTENGWVPTAGHAFAIPFYYYYEHVQQNSIHVLIDSLKQFPSSDREQTKARLKRIRKAIKAAPVSPELLQLIEKQAAAKNMPNRLRFRSSTNAEDIPGFNGAGLYKSKTGIIGDPKKTPEKAIRKVWASLWNERAYYEREYFGIDQSEVYMGILVHRSFPDEVANGVAITINPYDAGNPGHLINVQHGETSVVSPPPGIVCDQLVWIHSSRLRDDRPVIEYITRNSSGKEVLSDEEINELADILDSIRHHFYRNSRSRVKENQYAVDIEFKLIGPHRDIVIKQARPYPQPANP